MLPGEVKEDWWITKEIGKRICLDWNYNHPKDIFDEMKEAMPSLNNISWERLEKESSVTYPCLLYTSPSPRDVEESRMPSSA